MGEEHLTLKLTITELAAGRYRSRVEQSPAGASSSPDPEFELAEEQIQEWVGPLAKGTASRQELVKLGQELFDLVIKGQVLLRYQQCVALARERAAKLRIALSVRSSRLIAVPWEYMHDSQSFLLKRGESIVRVIDELPEKRPFTGPVERLLLAVANPQDQEQFNAEEHLHKLRKALGDLQQLDVLMPADADAIRRALLERDYDVFYFVGHGRFTEALAGQLVLEKDGVSQYLDADKLAEWTREGSVRFAYLNACSGGRTGVGNPFTGVAHRLLRDGGVTSVVAMQAPIAQRAALKIAEEFFADLQKGHSPEAALARSRTAPDDFVTWGLPVVYVNFINIIVQVGDHKQAELLAEDSSVTEALSPMGHHSPKLSGKAKLAIIKRLVMRWPDLATYLEIPSADQATFEKGHEPRRLLEWLEERGRLGELRDAFNSLGWNDLLEELDRYPQ